MIQPNITKGEWETDGLFVTSKEQPNKVVAHTSNAYVSGDIKIANAKAISAVPEMMKTGSRIVYCYENNLDITEAEIESLKEALLKAGCIEKKSAKEQIESREEELQKMKEAGASNQELANKVFEELK